MSQVFSENFSKKAQSLRPSPIRELLAVIKQPDMISFAGGMPAPEIFPIDQFYEGAHLLKDNGAELLQYATTEGDNALRKLLAKFMAPRLGREPDLKEILLTTGSQQALDLFGWSMINEGDVIITEDPTYMAALNVFLNHGATPIGIPCDDQGMRMDLLEEELKKQQSAGKKVKAIYSVINFQNPGGMTMSEARRRQLSDLSDKYGVPIFEDDPYGYVRYEGDHVPSVFSMNKNGNVLYAGSFSKILAPGTRIGWVVGPEDIVRKMTVFKQSTDLCSCSIAQSLIAAYMEKGYLESHLPTICENYRKRRDAMQESMERHLKPLGITWVKPEGGFFFWLDLGDVKGEELQPLCLQKKVAFILGKAFSVSGNSCLNNIRVNFTYCKPETIEEGVRRIAEAYKEIKESKK